MYTSQEPPSAEDSHSKTTTPLDNSSGSPLLTVDLSETFSGSEWGSGLTSGSKPWLDLGSSAPETSSVVIEEARSGSVVAWTSSSPAIAVGNRCSRDWGKAKEERRRFEKDSWGVFIGMRVVCESRRRRGNDEFWRIRNSADFRSRVERIMCRCCLAGAGGHLIFLLNDLGRWMVDSRSRFRVWFLENLSD